MPSFKGNKCNAISNIEANCKYLVTLPLKQSYCFAIFKLLLVTFPSFLEHANEKDRKIVSYENRILKPAPDLDD